MPMSQTLHYPLRYCKNIPWTPGKFYRPVPFRTVSCIRQFGEQRATDGWNVSSAASLASFVSSHAMRRRWACMNQLVTKLHILSWSSR